MKKLLSILFLIPFFTLPTQAQQLGLGAMVNFTSNGILTTYTPAWKGKWTLDLGVRYFIKTNLNGDNEAGYLYYQQGYAKNFWQRFGANARISLRLVRYKFVQLDFMTNGLITCEARREHDSYWGQDPETGEYGIFPAVNYFKASPAFELTIGPAINIDCSKNISCYVTAGYGLIYMHHSHTGQVVLFNNKPIENATVEIISVGEFYQNWKRGQMGGVGMEGPPMLPMLSAGIKYRLK